MSPAKYLHKPFLRIEIVTVVEFKDVSKFCRYVYYSLDFGSRNVPTNVPSVRVWKKNKLLHFAKVFNVRQKLSIFIGHIASVNTEKQLNCLEEKSIFQKLPIQIFIIRAVGKVE